MKAQRIYAGIAGIGMLLSALIIIQIVWLGRMRATQKKEADEHISRALEKTAAQLEQSIHCFEGYSKVFVDTGERFLIVHQKRDSFLRTMISDTLTIVYNPSGVYPDSAIIKDKVAGFHFPVMAEVQFNFRIPFSDTEQRSLQQAAVMDTLRPRTYRDLILNKLGIASLLNTGRVDSLLQHNLEAEHISKAQYGYGFTDDIKQTAEFAKRIADTDALARSAYSVRMFRNNQFLKPQHLSVVFSGFHYEDSFAAWLLLSIGIIALLFVAFLLFVRTYLRQRRLSEMKSDFINNLTHEFNTPMANIALAIETISGKHIQDEKTTRILNIISSESYRLRENIERALEVATMEKGGLQLRRELLDVGTLINTIIVGFGAQCEELGGSIQFEQKGKAVVYGDEVHLINSICNLLDNAIRYRAGPPVIRIALLSEMRSITLQIADNGIGMSLETQRHIFEKFYRAHHGDVHNTRGFGLGLNYVKGIITLHGGNISVLSRQGKGSTFTIHLPNANESSN